MMTAYEPVIAHAEDISLRSLELFEYDIKSLEHVSRVLQVIYYFSSVNSSIVVNCWFWNSFELATSLLI